MQFIKMKQEFFPHWLLDVAAALQAMTKANLISRYSLYSSDEIIAFVTE